MQSTDRVFSIAHSTSGGPNEYVLAKLLNEHETRPYPGEPLSQTVLE